eukprot:6027683-Alexandrium_andersonii.AAC.1
MADRDVRAHHAEDEVAEDEGLRVPGLRPRRDNKDAVGGDDDEETRLLQERGSVHAAAEALARTR